MDLFSHRARKDRRGQPLAERMRPRTLSEYVGQSHLLGPGRLLEQALTTGELPSLVLWGPPGTGKTTLARLLAEAAGARFVALSAVTAGVAQIREVVAEAGTELRLHGARTLLFLDEIHRFHKGQQDALLPHVEAGTVILVGATTENPSFEVNAALLSRTKVLTLSSLSEEELGTILARALEDPERGLGKLGLEVPGPLLERIAREAQGDARRALGTLELVASLARARLGKGASEAPPPVTAEMIEEALQKKTLLYDKGGDEHYNVVSAFIKSMRGSDPDAAVYWMARMLEAGEDPLFVVRRMVIFAAEDVGNADPRALAVAVSALEAVRLVGMPEGVLPMTQAALYLATAPKSNTALTTYAAARQAVNEHGALAVPLHVRNAPTPLMKGLGYGAGYQYPHDFDGGHVAEEYLPERLRGARFYEPRGSGYERQIAERLRRWRGEGGEGGEE